MEIKIPRLQRRRKTSLEICFAYFQGFIAIFPTCSQNPSGLCFLGGIRVFVIETSLGLPNIDVNEKDK